MALDFPNSPTNGSTYTSGIGSWIWDGTKWNAASTQQYVPIAGGTMTGLLILSADPTAALGAATKQYVDVHTGSGTYLPLTGGTLTGLLTISNASYAQINYLNTTAPIAAGGLWRTYVGTGGNFNIQTNTAAAGDFSTQIVHAFTATGALGINNAPPADAYAGSIFPTLAMVFPFTTLRGVITTNAYRDGSKLLAAGAANSFNMGAGGFYFYSAPSGAAGAAPSWVQTASIDASGNLTLAANCFLGSNSLFFAGSTNVGPKMYGDVTNILWQLGSGNGGWYWYNNGGGLSMSLGAGGNLSLAGYMYVQGQSDPGQSTTQAGFSRTRWRFAVTSGDDGSAGSIGYRDFDGGALGIVGAGTNGSNRTIRMWDRASLACPTPTDAVPGAFIIYDSLCIAGAPATAILYNAYHTGGGGAKYINSAPASAFNADNGGFSFYTSPSGTAGNAVSWTNTASITSSGDMYLTGNLHNAGNYIWQAGGGGGVNTSGGPFIYADPNNTVIHLGTAATGTGNCAGYVQRADGVNIGGFRDNGVVCGALLRWIASVDGDSGNGHVWLYDTSHNGAVVLGGSADQQNYYRNTTHTFQSVSGGNTYCQMTPNALLFFQNFATSNASIGGFINGQALNYTPNYGLIVENNGGNGWSLTCNRNWTNGTVIQFQQGTANPYCGNIQVLNGNSTAYTSGSDGRRKRDLREFDAGPVIDRLRVYDFEWEPNDKAQGVRAHGVVAQEGAEVYPEAFFYDEESDWWGVDYAKFVPLLLNEVKALRSRLAQLEAKGRS